MKNLVDYTDSEFNDLLREIYRETGQRISEDPEVMTKVAKYLGLKIPPPSDNPSPDRF